MADENILRPVPFIGDDESEKIKIINRDFLLLAQRIKKLNEQYSYWDMMRIAEIFSCSIDPEGESEPQEQEKLRQDIYQQFISTTWARLPNYSGAYISLSAQGAYFKLDDDKVRNGDYVIKLPGGEFLYIPGPAGLTYYPESEIGNPFNIIYAGTYTATPGYTTSFTIPTVVGSNLCAVSGATVEPGATLFVPGTTIAATVTDARWYTDTGEEVMWDHSFSNNLNAPVINITSMTLRADYLYQRITPPWEE